MAGEVGVAITSLKLRHASRITCSDPVWGVSNTVRLTHSVRVWFFNPYFQSKLFGKGTIGSGVDRRSPYVYADYLRCTVLNKKKPAFVFADYGGRSRGGHAFSLLRQAGRITCSDPVLGELNQISKLFHKGTIGSGVTRQSPCVCADYLRCTIK